MGNLTQDDLFELYMEYSQDALPTVDQNDVEDWNSVISTKDEAREWMRLGIMNPFDVANFKKYKLTPDDLLKMTYSGITYIEAYLTGQKNIYDLVKELKSKKRDDDSDDDLITI